MRASRLLQMLLLLQNRGRLTSAELAEELEVSTRTILRDVDAMTEAGLPIIVHQGNQGGIELGFNYRTRLTGLDQDEAESLGVVLSSENPTLEALGMRQAYKRARSKLVESFPDKVRATVERAGSLFNVRHEVQQRDDPRLEAFAEAVRSSKIVRIQANTDDAYTIHPISLRYSSEGWSVTNAKNGAEIPLSECGDINISAHRFERESI